MDERLPFTARFLVVTAVSITSHDGCNGSRALIYDPIYEALGVPAVLAPNRPDATGIAVTVIERTTSTDASEEFDLHTVRPGTFVRRRALDEAGIASAELDGGLLAFVGRTWRIDAHAARPGPDGESSGEILMFLSDGSHS